MIIFEHYKYKTLDIIFCNDPKQKNPKEFFVEGTKMMLTSGLTYKITPSLLLSIVKW